MRRVCTHWIREQRTAKTGQLAGYGGKVLGRVKHDVQIWVPVVKMVLLRAQGEG